MNAILGITHVLLQSQPTAEQAMRLGKIDASARHLLNIINDVLDLSKIESGRFKLEDTDFALGALLEQVRSMLADQAAEKGLELRIDCSDVPNWLRGDPTRVRQALLNYIGNAVKFTEHGRIGVRVRVLEGSEQALLLRFEVQDTGIGIAADVLPRLFEDFEQADTTTTRRYGGTGLGLAVVRRLARLMGGEAGAHSLAGHGSLFWFSARLERARSPAPASAVAVEATASPDTAKTHLRRRRGLRCRLLVVDDVAVNREVAMELLQLVGLTVDMAETGAEAIMMAAGNAYDLILMAVQMPGISGIEATRVIRSTPGGGQVPIVAMTANAFAQDRADCLDAGMNDHLAKPVDPELLYATLVKWLPTLNADDRAALDSSHAGLAGIPGPELLAALSDLPGLNLTAGLKFVGGKVSTYLRVLNKFAEDHAHDLDAVADLLVAGRFGQARLQAHSVKGMAGTLGAERLQTMSGKLQLHVAELEGQQLAIANVLSGAESAREELARLTGEIRRRLG